jgi:hypothetical protein
MRLGPALALLTSIAPATFARLNARASRYEAYATIPGARAFYTDTGAKGFRSFLHAATGTTSPGNTRPGAAAAGYRASRMIGAAGPDGRRCAGPAGTGATICWACWMR